MRPVGSLLRIPSNPSKSCRGKMHLKLGHFYQIRVTAWVVARQASCSWDRNKQCLVMFNVLIISNVGNVHCSKLGVVRVRGSEMN